MSIFEPNGWQKQTCDICGIDTPKEGIYIMICMADGNNEEQFPFVQLTLCRDHADYLGPEGMLKSVNGMLKEDED